MTKNYKRIYKRYYQWLCICRKNIIIFELSIAYNIEVANFACTCKGQSYRMHLPWASSSDYGSVPEELPQLWELVRFYEMRIPVLDLQLDDIKAEMEFYSE